MGTTILIHLTIIPKIAIFFILLELQVKLGSFGPLGGGLKTILINNSGYLLNLNQINEFINLIFTSPFGDNINISTFSSLSTATASTPPIGEGVLVLTQGRDLLDDCKEISIVINNNILKTLLLISATLSLIIGSLLGLAQIRIKRLLAYSTISHIGFILLALAVNTEQSIDSFIFYIIQYTITNLNIFLIILGLTYCLSNNTSLLWIAKARSNHFFDISFFKNKESWPAFYSNLYNKNKNGESRQATRDANPASLSTEGYKDISFISEFKGLFFSNPLLSISLAVSLFSMAGIPPLIGFFSKQLVLYSALQNGYYFISVLAIIVSVISCSYYLQIIKVLFTPSRRELAFGKEQGLNAFFKTDHVLVNFQKSNSSPNFDIYLDKNKESWPAFYSNLYNKNKNGESRQAARGVTPLMESPSFLEAPLMVTIATQGRDVNLLATSG
jgi:hypothetical protein